MTQGKALAQYGAVTVSVDDGDDGGSSMPPAMATAVTYGEATSLVPDAVGGGTAEGESWIKAHDVELAENDDVDGSPRFQDVPFAVLFYLHLAAMIYVGVSFGTWGEPAASYEGDASDSDFGETHLSRIVYYLVLPSVGVSFALTYTGTAVIIPLCPETAVKASVVSSLVTTGIFCLLVIISAPGILTVVGTGAMFAFFAWYVKKVWRLIPFAAANLKTALVGMSANWGTYLIALAFTATSSVWAVFWMYAANGVFTREEAEDKLEAEDNLEAVNTDDSYAAAGKIHWGPLFLLLVSLYWTSMVLLNMIQTTVAGVMGTWCFAKEDATTCCSPAVTSSLYRTCTYAFGSVCLGSLMDAIIKALRVMAEMAKNQSRNSDDECSGGAAILFCILECILRMLEDIIEYFNQWAYVFVGMYGYSYIESGRKVMELFRARGWTAIITDDLVGYVLNVTAVTVAIVSGLIALAIEAWTPSGYLFGDDMEGAGAGWAAFFVGVIIGLFVSSVMMNVIKGAVNTVVVCFADAPAKLEANHPQLTYDMAVSWVSVFPDCGVHVPPKQPVAATVVV